MKFRDKILLFRNWRQSFPSATAFWFSIHTPTEELFIASATCLQNCASFASLRSGKPKKNKKLQERRIGPCKFELVNPHSEALKFFKALSKLFLVLKKPRFQFKRRNKLNNYSWTEVLQVCFSYDARKVHNYFPGQKQQTHACNKRIEQKELLLNTRPLNVSGVLVLALVKFCTFAEISGFV